MSSSSSSPDFSGPCPENGYYDVFLSFRGKDTRFGFTANLYQSLKNNKIYSFMDIKNLGYDINRLFEMVEMSKVAVVICSESFAASAWCLKELKMILQRREEKKMLIIPIFYNIDVDELKHLTGKTGKYLDEHIQKHGETTVKEWKTAVITLGHVSGLSYKIIHNRYEFEFIAEVVAKTKEKLEEWGETLQSSSKPYNSGPATEHDVFINFMGEDTRYHLVNHLYKALMIRKVMRTFFMDDRDLLKDDSIFEVIQRSKIAVIVFSQNYASSKWCLRELVKILQCRKQNTTRQLVVLPIFYEITPTDLINQAAKGSRIACQLEEHVLDEEAITIQSWRDAITELGYMDGWPYSTAHSSKRELAEFIRELVEEISTILNRLDEKTESTGNQQACVSGKEENTQALSVQTYTSSPRLCNSEECPVRSGKGTADGSFDASVSGEMGDVTGVDDADVEVSVGEMDSTALKRVEEMVLSSNDQQQQADEESFSHTNTTIGDEVYHIVTSAYFQKSSEITGELELISIKPSYLKFYVERGKRSSSCLILTNKTNNYVAFTLKMDTIKPQDYSINPNKGLLQPRSTCQIIVTMEVQTVIPSDGESKDKFLIQSLKAKKDSYSTTYFSNMFTGKSRNAIDKFGMPVLYVAPTPRDSSIPDHLAQLAYKGLVHGSMRVSSIDPHPTKPWLLLGLFCGFMCIWNYQTRVEEKSFKVDDWKAVLAKFIYEKPWIVFRTCNGFVCVFDYNTSKKVNEFKAHEDFLECIAVHPTSPYVLTTSDDKLVKLWNWENDWACIETFEGHSSYVVDVAFNPKDSRSFASVSLDGTIKIWSFTSPVAKFTINAHSTLVNCVEYFVGNNDKLYLLSGSYDNTVRVWDYESKTLVQTLEGHSNVVKKTLVHPKLPIIITASLDKTIRIWNKNTHRFKLIWTSDLGEVWSIGFIQASNEVVLGCDNGMVVIKIVDAVGTQSG